MRNFPAVVLVALLAAAFSASAGEVESPQITNLEWLTGHWRGNLGGAVIEEIWLSPAGGQMIGINRTLVDGVSVAFEYLRIGSDGGNLFYLASPGGRCPPTSFPVESIEENQISFANPSHDFPQRISYRREGDSLNARIEGIENGEPKSIEWSWTLVTTPGS